MHFTMKGGILTEAADRQVQAILKGAFLTHEKRVFAKDGTLSLRTDIRCSESFSGRTDRIRSKEYVLYSPDGRVLAEAKPDYADNDDIGWPASRIPYVGHARVRQGDRTYFLSINRNRDYHLSNESNQTIADFSHRGLAGGWSVEADDNFPADLLCGVFAFCQYLEQENEI